MGCDLSVKWDDGLWVWRIMEGRDVLTSGWCNSRRAAVAQGSANLRRINGTPRECEACGKPSQPGTDLCAECCADLDRRLGEPDIRAHGGL